MLKKIGILLLAVILFSGFIGVSFSAQSISSLIGGQNIITGVGKINVIKVNIDATLDTKGVVHSKMVIKFPSVASYLTAKRVYPSPYVMMRYLLTQNADNVLKNAAIKYRDSDRCVVVEADVLGEAVNRQGVWEVDMGKDADLVWMGDRLGIFVVVSSSRDSAVVSYMKVNLPEEAYDVNYDETEHLLTYSLPKVKPPKNVVTRVKTKLVVKPRIMSATYKIYGDPEFSDGYYWVARAEITNDGNSSVYDLTVRYKMEGFCDWSEPHTYSVLVPGETVVDLYYPVVPSKVARLTTRTPSMVVMKYTYKDEKGRVHTEYKHRRLHILGIEQFEFSNIPPEERTGSWMDNFSNAPLIAAWVTRLDPVVKKFAGMVSRYAGGVPTSLDNKSAVKFCRALFELEMANGITYQTPSGFLMGYTSEQDVKYPRDTLRDKSGTCIDLAILYASVCESVGLETAIVLIPGHAFPVIFMPDGGMLPVETTTRSFDEAVKIGYKNLRELRNGLYYVVDLEEMWKEGVVNPELPALGPDVLEKWGYKIPKRNPGIRKAGLTGRWVGVGRSRTGGASRITMDIRQKGNNLTGRCVIVPGGNGVFRGVVQGNKFKIVAVFTAPNGRFQIVFNGVIQGNVMKGAWNSPGSGASGDFMLKKSR